MRMMVLALPAALALAACEKPHDIACGDNAKTLTGGSVHKVKCPANCGDNGSLWGTDNYTTDSSVCKAAIHAGVIGKDGGVVTVTLGAGRPSYEGSERNGVTSSGWGPYDASFTVK